MNWTIEEMFCRVRAGAILWEEFEAWVEARECKAVDRALYLDSCERNEA